MNDNATSREIDDIGNPRFLELLQEVGMTHRAKAAGYSGSDNPDTWANFREAEAWGLTALDGCLVRMGDKYRRVQNLMRNPDNDQVGESIRDTLMDLANYALIAVCLFEESEAAGNSFLGYFEPPRTPYDEPASQKSYLEQLGQAEKVAATLHTLYGSSVKRAEKDWQADAVRVLRAMAL